MRGYSRILSAITPIIQVFRKNIRKIHLHSISQRNHIPFVPGVMESVPEVVKDLLVKGVDAVCFDVDSTVCTTEGIDELAAFLGVGEQVAAVTKQAMEGGLSFRDALSQRLTAMRITRDKLEEFVVTHPPALCPGVKELITVLHEQRVKVFLVSGGFTSLICPILPELDGIIPEEHVYANKFVFEGEFATFDPSQPTSASGGKALAVQAIMECHQCRTVIAIGDGATDLEARPPAAAMIGYGGIAAREKVIKNADWFVYHFDDITRAFKTLHDSNSNKQE